MDSFNAPFGKGEGNMDTGNKARQVPSGTQWTVASDTSNLVSYYHTAWNRQIRKIDLKEIDFTKSKVRKIPVDEEQAQNIKDVTQGLR